MSTRRRLVGLCLFILVGLIVCPRPPRVNAVQVLQRTLAAEGHQCYRARRVYSWIYYGKKLRQTRWETEPAAQPDLRRLVYRNYRPFIEGDDRIAGRECWILRMRPARKYRPWKQLWVDKKSYIVLAAREWTHSDTIRSTMRTLSLKPGSVQAVLSGDKPGSRSTAGWPGRLGHFELVRVTGAPEQETAIYTDGLFPMVVRRRFPIGRAREQDQRPRIYDWSQGLVFVGCGRGGRYTVVADLSEREIRAVARALP